jgi:fumarylacetoacetate (FAA) hydrolase
MKLATLKDGSRDGQLIVVSRDLGTAHFATGIAQRLQQALDDWNFIAPQLQDVYDALNLGRARHPFPFDPARCMAPLPRAYQWIEGDAYSSPADRVPEGSATIPWLRQCASDDLLGPCDDIAPNDAGIDFGAQLAAIVADVPAGATPEQGLDAVRLLMLANAISLPPQAGERETASFAEGFQTRLATAFGPVAVTPEELGDAWQDGRVHLTLQTTWNGRKVGLCDAGADMRWAFGDLVAHAARHRRLRAGTLIGSGVVRNAAVDSEGRREWPKGYASIADKRVMEQLQDGAAQTEYLKPGDTVRVDMRGRDGQPVLGTVEQRVALAGI